MIISIASGKGGTGKTTVATNLLASIPGEAAILDCDVEAPNAHLFLSPTLDKKEVVDAPIPQVDEAACTHCKKCMEICRYGAIAVMGKKVITFPELCHSCGGCFRICPEDAVTEVSRPIGLVETGSFVALKNKTFARGSLEIGQVMAPPIIRQVRTREKDTPVTIIDAPPGTSCPVIAAMKGADVAILVTEPTPFGLHDLTLAVEAVKVLGLPRGLIINRAGMGNDAVYTYAKKENLPILMEIPFDRQIAQAYSTGTLLVDALPQYRDKFITLFENIKKLAAQSPERRNP